MSRLIKIKKPIFLILLLILAVFGFFIQKAHAGWFDEAASSAASSLLLYMSNVVMSFLGNTLSWTADLLGSFLKLQGNYFEGISIVKNSWAVFRDFTNMFFILVLIVIAFATIFDMGQYNWKGLMAKFIFAALFINFSLAIGGFIIKISTTLSNVMLSQFTDITQNLAGGFGLNQLIEAKGVSASGGDILAGVLMTQFISSIGMIVLTAIVLLAFLSALIFSIARVPMLWGLLIVSPIAWISSILPQTRPLWSLWWKHFICWTFFLPAYLFTLVIGLSILANRPEIETAIDLSKASGLAQANNFFGLGVQGVFFYLLTTIILVGGLAFSLKMACAAGLGLAKISSGANKWAQNNFGYSALKKGITEKAGEIKETGFRGRIGGFLYGGERAERIREAKVAEFLGKKGALSETEAAEVKKSYERWKSQNLDKNQLSALNAQAIAGKFNKFELLALRKLRAENGWIASGADGEKEIKDTLQMAGANSKYAQEYLAAGEKNEWTEALGSRDQTERFAHNLSAEFLPLKKSIMKQLAKNNQVITKEFAKEILDIFSTESKDAKNAIEKDLQKNIKNFAETRIKKDRATALTNSSILPESLRRLLAAQMSEDGEITTYEKYKKSAELFGGENEAKSREMLDKIAKDKPAAHADVLFRQELGRTEPDTLAADHNPLDATNVTPQRQQMFIDQVKKKLPKMSAKTMVEADIDFWKDRPEFETALWKHIETEEQAEPTTRRGAREKAGGGKRILQRIQKALQDSPDPDKRAVVDGLMNRLTTQYPAQSSPGTP